MFRFAVLLNTVMRVLWDRHPVLPYMAWAPWPRVDHRGQVDWVGSIDQVESWLVSSVGRRWIEWTWGWSTFAMDLAYNQCCVNFLTDRDRVLFLLKFS